jgi:L,D-peptidoglycan transpeptidase YkuD (ErfK/YbiS/YcfS/YnhG family)
VPGLGSAIFLHDDKGSATNGCISLPRPELLKVLRWLWPGATISIKLA